MPAVVVDAMVEIQCTSCHTRYRIDERVLPAETPTFKCSRCGHVFNTEPRSAKSDSAGERPVEHNEEAIAQPPASAVKVSRPAAQEVRLQTNQVERKSATQAKSVENPLAKSFSESTEETKVDENLTFDFAEDDPPHQLGSENSESLDTQAETWSVGDNQVASSVPERQKASESVKSKPASPLPAGIPRPLKAADRSLEVEVAAAYVSKQKAHSSLLFLGVFFLVVMAFGVISFGIITSPAASLDILSDLPGLRGHLIQPAEAEAIDVSEIRAQYDRLHNGERSRVLLIGGRARNLTDKPLHMVQVEADLVDATGIKLAGQTVNCGNSITPRMVIQMTRREIDFFSQLDPPKNFALAPNQSSKFLLVFVDPPAALSRFTVTVVKTGLAEASSPVTPGA